MLKQVNLLVVSSIVSDGVFSAMNQVEDFSAGAFGDNGGDPDGAGPYMAEVDEFSQEALQAALQAGAQIAKGYRVEYGYNHEAAQDSGLEFSGYQVCNTAYALSEDVARKVYELSHQGQE